MHTSKGDQRSGVDRIRVVGLRVDYSDRPFGLDNPRPRFSWRLQSSEHNVSQSAYRITVASSRAAIIEGHAELWDSGRVDSHRCFAIPYEGRPLQSRQQCWWRVQIWDEAGRSFASSDHGEWEMGLLSPQDWVAEWLAADDAVTRADRETPLEWMWSAETNDEIEERRSFRCTIDLPTATRGGVFFAVGRTFEKVTHVFIDGMPVATTYPGSNLTRERLALPPLPAGSHCIEFGIDRKNPLPETFWKSRPAGIAVFVRFDGREGGSIRLGAGADWKTRTQRDDSNENSWSVAATTPLSGHVLAEPALQLRHSFVVGKNLIRARLYATALGCYEATLNGKRVGIESLAPELSQYEKRIRYRTWDVTTLLVQGPNAIGFTIGDGWYGSHPGRYAWGPPPRRVLGQLELIYADESREVIGTGSHWRVARGPIQQSEICVGEIYDARLAEPGWDTAAFDDTHWELARVAEVPSGRVVAPSSPPIRATQLLAPHAITEPQPGVYVVDFGQNFAGWCRLRVRGAAGTRIDIRFGEELLPSGEIDQFSLNGGKACDTYVLRGDPAGETFEPRFAYHGFRYAQLTGLPVAPSSDAISGVVIHSDLQLTGRLRIEHPLIDRLSRALLWTQRSNFVGIPTDCPNRAERMGYFCDASVFWDTAAFNMDLAAFTRSQMENARDHQYASGAFAPLAPAPAQFSVYRAADDTATPGWADGAVLLAWTSWRRYGDTGVIEENWDAMNRYLQFIADRNPNYLWKNGRGPDLGDWLAIGEVHFFRPEIPPTTSLDLLATAYWAHSASLLSQMAQAVGRVADAERLLHVHRRVRQAFIETFVQPNGQVGNGSQTSYLIALRFDLIPAELRSKALEWLVQDIRSRGVAVSTGYLGTQFVLDALVDGGYADVAYSLLLREEYPSWGFMTAHGATTFWERWDGSLQRNYMTASRNHFSLAPFGGFLFRRIVGIDELEPGFQRIRVRPVLDPRVRKAGGEYDSVMGSIAADWECRPDGEFVLNVTIPANCTALVHVPTANAASVSVNGRASSRDNLGAVTQSASETVFQVGSGSYCFTVRASERIVRERMAHER